ncbi:CWC27 protein, partial [Amia calva]|nr:CWC27 protein [Amia calva]
MPCALSLSLSLSLSPQVLLKTSAGDIDVELWSKEAPKACRNFVQLCLEGYYDGTIFHRVVPEFIVQGGDPSGTGEGGESVYGRPFKDEFHSRLRFNRRGLAAMANAGPHDNGSQFFFTLGRADELNNKHTIFGKVTGDTVYNLLRLAEVETDQNERPLNPHKIRGAEASKSSGLSEGGGVGTQNFSLLSFGEEAEEEEEMVNKVSQSMKGRSKSSHDLLKDDPRLSSVPAVDSEAEADYDTDEREQMKERVSKKLRRDKTEEVKPEPTEEKKTSRSEELRKEARQLKKDLLAIKQRKGVRSSPRTRCGKKRVDSQPHSEEPPPNVAVAEYLEERKKYEDLRKQKLKKGASREAQTMALLDRFKSKLSTAITEAPEEDTEELEEDDDKGWLSHVLQFDEQSRKVKDATVQDEDTFEIYDPRNPVNKRRREESKKIMREKKERR